ncbi:MAG: helix-turn-helix transcriptional regulator [Aeromonas sp.]
MKNEMFIERKRLTDLIGCRFDTIDRMVERGELPRPIRLGRNGRYRFIRAEIEPALKLHGIDLVKLETALSQHNANNEGR